MPGFFEPFPNGLVKSTLISLTVNSIVLVIGIALGGEGGCGH